MKRYIFFLVPLLLISNAFALGVSPPRIVLEDLPKDYVLEKSVILNDIQNNSLVTISFSGQGSEWVESKLGNSFVKQDNEDLELPFIIRIPKKAPNGEYEVYAQIIVSSEQKNSEPNSASISSGIMVNIKFTVSGKEVIEYSITNVQILNTETGLPVVVAMKIKNHGNTMINPEKAKITIKDKEKIFVASSISERITSVEPYTAGESTVSFDLDLDPEFYFADLDIYTYKGIEKIENLPFDVFQRGALKADGELISLKIGDNVENIAKIEASFINRGEIGMHSILKAEVYKENTLVDVIESEPVFVRIGDTIVFTNYYKVPGSGKYMIKAHTEFLGKSTNTKEVSFIAASTGIDRLHLLLSAIAVIVLLSLTILAKIIKRKTK